MADLTSAATPELQAEAAAMGWIGPEKFKGDPERFVDADEFIKRGETVLPIVKQQLATTRAEMETLKKQAGETAAALERANKALENIELENSVRTQKAVEAAKLDLKAKLRVASEAGDHEAIAEITGMMIDLNAAPADKKDEEKKDDPPPAPQVDPVVAAWVADGNEWYGKDRRKTALALGIATEMREKGDKRTGVAFLNDVKKEVFATFGEADRAGQVDKVEGGRNGNGSEDSSRGNGKVTYQHLPKDAKEACDADIKRFVGPGKRYKDDASYRANWAQTYFSQER